MGNFPDIACCIIEVEEGLVLIEPTGIKSLGTFAFVNKAIDTPHSILISNDRTKLDNSPYSSLFLHTLLNLLKHDDHHQQLLPCQSFSAPSRDLDSGDPDLWGMMPLLLFLPSQNQSRKLGHLCR